MAALLGFDTWDESATVATPITLGATLLTIALPARITIGGIDLSVSDIDTNATPLVKLDIGDADDDNRFVAADTTGQGGGDLEYRPLNTAWYRYSAAASVLVTVNTAPATGASGAIAATIYGYPSADVSTLTRQSLQVLGVLAEGETARAEDASLALEALRDVHEMLRGKGIANRQDLAWTLSVVPLFAARPYAAMAANLLADTFGVSAQRAQRLAARAAEAEREMRRQTRKPSSGDPVTLEPYEEDDTATLNTGVLA